MGDQRMEIRHFRDLRVYQAAIEMAMRIFQLSKQWPRDERYSMTDQVRRCSRSVAANIAEAWRKRRYPAHFVSKLSDADSESAETQAWLDFALRCEYIDTVTFRQLDEQYNVICGGLVKMMAETDKWCGPAQSLRETETEYLVNSPTPNDSHSPNQADAN